MADRLGLDSVVTAYANVLMDHKLWKDTDVEFALACALLELPDAFEAYSSCLTLKTQAKTFIGRMILTNKFVFERFTAKALQAALSSNDFCYQTQSFHSENNLYMLLCGWWNISPFSPIKAPKPWTVQHMKHAEEVLMSLLRVCRWHLMSIDFLTNIVRWGDMFHLSQEDDEKVQNDDAPFTFSALARVRLLDYITAQFTLAIEYHATSLHAHRRLHMERTHSFLPTRLFQKEKDKFYVFPFMVRDLESGHTAVHGSVEMFGYHLSVKLRRTLKDHVDVLLKFALLNTHRPFYVHVATKVAFVTLAPASKKIRMSAYEHDVHSTSTVLTLESIGEMTWTELMAPATRLLNVEGYCKLSIKFAFS